MLFVGSLSSLRTSLTIASTFFAAELGSLHSSPDHPVVQLHPSIAARQLPWPPHSAALPQYSSLQNLPP
jgi:hypothetical protein